MDDAIISYVLVCECCGILGMVREGEGGDKDIAIQGSQSWWGVYNMIRIQLKLYIIYNLPCVRMLKELSMVREGERGDKDITIQGS